MVSLLSYREEDMMTIKQEPDLDDGIEYLEPEDPDDADGMMPGEENHGEPMADEPSDMMTEDPMNDACHDPGHDPSHDPTIEETTNELLEAEEQELLALQQMQQEAAMVAVAAHSGGVWISAVPSAPGCLEFGDSQSDITEL